MKNILLTIILLASTNAFAWGNASRPDLSQYKLVKSYTENVNPFDYSYSSNEIRITKVNCTIKISERIAESNSDELAKQCSDIQLILKISIHEWAAAFSFNPPTLQRLESGKKTDLSTIRRIQIYLEFPQVALWEVELNAGKIHTETFQKLSSHFTSQMNSLSKKK